MTTRYRAFSDSSTQSCLLSPEAEAEHRRKGLLGPDAVLLWEFDAATWEEAMSIHHLRMGFEPYKPLGDGQPRHAAAGWLASTLGVTHDATAHCHDQDS